jgi:uncharacterized protein (TIGR00290 family)
MKRKALLAWSGGKDSAWMLHVLRRDPSLEIAGLFTTVDEDEGRVAVHAVRPALLAEQARLAGASLHCIAIPRPCPNVEYERRMAEFLARAKADGVTHLAFGDLFLEDIRRYRERQFEGSGFELLFPLWGLPTRPLAEEMTAGGLAAWIVCVDTRRAPRGWAGRVYDERFVDEIPEGIDPCGENGEFHTFVFQGPMLGARVAASPGEISEREGFAYSDLVPASE